MQYLLTHVRLIRWIRKTWKSWFCLFGTESTVAEWWWHFVASAATSLTTILFFQLDFVTIYRERQLQVSLAFRLLVWLSLLCRTVLSSPRHGKFRRHNALAWASIRAYACRGIARAPNYSNWVVLAAYNFLGLRVAVGHRLGSAPLWMQRIWLWDPQ